MRGHRIAFLFDPRFSGLTTPCVPCVPKESADTLGSLTSDEPSVLALCDQIMTRKRPADHTLRDKGDQPGNMDAQEPPVSAPAARKGRNTAGNGPRRGDRLEVCRNALQSWRIEAWARDFRRSGLMPEAILPDKMLSKLATHARLKTLDLIKAEAPGWILAERYGEDVLKVLEPIDKVWIEEAKQRKEENRAKRAKQSAENKIRREETARAARLRASDERKAAKKGSASQSFQSSSTTVAPMSQPLQLCTPDAAPLAYPSYYPHSYYIVHPYYAYSFYHPSRQSQSVLEQGASSSQSTSYIPRLNAYTG